MRRSEFHVKDPQLIEHLLEEAEHLHLGCLAPDGFPYVTAVNYAWVNQKVYIHSSLKGQKVSFIQQNNKVYLSLAEPFAFIPSWATDPDVACGATQFFQSVHIKGTALLVQDLDLKAAVMASMMKKMQPEGRHLDLSDPKHRAPLKGMALIEVTPEMISAKFKFGQNLKGKKRESVIAALEKSTDPRAQQTLLWIESLVPEDPEV